MQLQKTSALRNLFIFKAPLLFANYFFPNKPHTQTFLTLHPKWAPEEELCLNNNSAFRGRNSSKFWIIWIIVIQMSSLFIHITNFKITITNPTIQKIKTYHDCIAYSFLFKGCFCFPIFPCFPKHTKFCRNFVTKKPKQKIETWRLVPIYGNKYLQNFSCQMKRQR